MNYEPMSRDESSLRDIRPHNRRYDPGPLAAVLGRNGILGGSVVELVYGEPCILLPTRPRLHREN
jgi:hypothetical protein